MIIHFDYFFTPVKNCIYFLFYFLQMDMHMIDGVNEINLSLTFLSSLTSNFLALKVTKESKGCFSKKLGRPSHITVPRRSKAVFFSTVPAKSIVPFENPPPRRSPPCYIYFCNFIYVCNQSKMNKIFSLTNFSFDFAGTVDFAGTMDFVGTVDFGGTMEKKTAFGLRGTVICEGLRSFFEKQLLNSFFTLTIRKLMVGDDKKVNGRLISLTLQSRACPFDESKKKESKYHFSRKEIKK